MTQQFGTAEDNQIKVEIRVYQTPDKVDTYPVDEDRFLGTAELNLKPNTPAQSVISITLKLTADGMVKLHGKDETSGSDIDAEWKAENALDDQELQEAKERVSTSTSLSME